MRCSSVTTMQMNSHSARSTEVADVVDRRAAQRGRSALVTHSGFGVNSRHTDIALSQHTISPFHRFISDRLHSLPDSQTTNGCPLHPDCATLNTAIQQMKHSLPLFLSPKSTLQFISVAVANDDVSRGDDQTELRCSLLFHFPRQTERPSQSQMNRMALQRNPMCSGEEDIETKTSNFSCAASERPEKTERDVN